MKRSDKWRRFLLVAIVLMTSWMISGCGTLDDSGAAGIRGLVTQMTPGEEGTAYIAVIMVEGTAEENSGLVSDKASVTLTKETVFVNGDLKKHIKQADLAALIVGTRVEIVFSGPVAESYPVQGRAKVVRISK